MNTPQKMTLEEALAIVFTFASKRGDLTASEANAYAHATQLIAACAEVAVQRRIERLQARKKASLPVEAA